MHALPLVLASLCFLAIAYRYYSAFLAARVLCLDDSRPTPAHLTPDGHNYVPTRKWVLFGHHFAAITGSGPLIGPVLAMQFGYLPGLLWIVIGVALGGAVHDFVILTASVRRGGKSLAEIARQEIGEVAAVTTSLAILFIVVIAMSGLAMVVVGALKEEPWGTFTVACTVPLALAMGVWTYVIRKGAPRAVTEATAVGVVGLLLAVWMGDRIPGSVLAPLFTYGEAEITWIIAGYGLLASILPVWLLLCPRDYLSSFMKLGTIAVLILGVLWVNPELHAPALSSFIDGGGPIVKGKLFPFVFVTIACGAISGFHSLVASGTTPKMIDKESHCRPIGYGAMLMEGVVGLTALVAAASLHPGDYYAINVNGKVDLVRAGLTVEEAATLPPQDQKKLGWKEGVPSDLSASKAPLSEVVHLSPQGLQAFELQGRSAATLSEMDYQKLLEASSYAGIGVKPQDLAHVSQQIGESVAGRTGGGVSLAVGMGSIFAGMPLIGGLLSYWYRFVIMFEALFILTTIDTGTRVARFMLQEFLGRVWKPMARTEWMPGTVFSSALVVGGWVYFLRTGSVSTIWPMFGVANQLLATIALCVGTTVIVNSGKGRYAFVALLPLVFVGTTTLTAGYQLITSLFLPMTKVPATAFQGWLDAILTGFMMLAVGIVLGASLPRWLSNHSGRGEAGRTVGGRA